MFGEGPVRGHWENSDTPNQRSSHLVSTLFSLCPVWVIKQLTGKETSPSPNSYSIYLYLFFNILSFCLWGWEGVRRAGFFPHINSLRTTQSGLKVGSAPSIFQMLYASIILGWPNSSFGFFRNILRKTQMNCLANPILFIGALSSAVRSLLLYPFYR